MAHLIVHRSAHAVRVALIMQRCRNTAHAGRHVVDNLVDFRRIHALMNVLLNIIEHRDIDLAALLNPCNLICILPGEAGIIPLNAVTPVLGAPVIIYVIVNQRKIQYFN